MNKTPHLLALCLCLSPLACAATVVGGGGGTGAGSSVSSSSETGQTSCGGGAAPGEPPPATPTAIALLASQIDWNPPTSSGGTSGSSSGGTSGSSSTGGNGVDPNTLYVMIGSPVPSCTDPFNTGTSQCGATFAVYIGIPPAMQQPGTISLDAPGVISTFSESGPPSASDPEVCPGGGGSFTDGSMEITSLDATQVTFTLSGTMMFAGEGVPDEIANGTYTAPRCP